MPVTLNTTSIVTRLRNTAGVKAVYLPGASAFEDAIGSDDMSLEGDAAIESDYVNFPGESTDFVTTAGAPAWQTGFAAASPALSWRTSGITVGGIFRIQSADLANRTLVHWFNRVGGSGNYCRWMVRFWEAAGGETLADDSLATAGGVYLQFWNAYGDTAGDGVGDDEAPYLDPVAGVPATGTQADPRVSDRFFTIPVNLKPLMADGQWHLFQFSRGTDAASGAAEKKLVVIDNVTAYSAGTGNGINGFRDITVDITIGKSESTTIVDDPTFGNFKGDMRMFYVSNRWTTESDMRALYAAGTNSASLRTRGRMTRSRVVA